MTQTDLFRKPAFPESAPATPVVFFPGWGFDGRVISLAEQELPWIVPVEHLDPETYAETLVAFLNREDIEAVDLVGWSLGANLALDFAGRYPERTSSVVLLSMRKKWPPSEIDLIRNELGRDPRAFLEDFYRKCFAGYREVYKRFRAELLKDYLEKADISLLLKCLDYLRDFPEMGEEKSVDRAAFLTPWGETYLLHGRRDTIAPVDQMAELPGVESRIFGHDGHPVFLSSEFRLPSYHRKLTIQGKFSKAAATYDQYADVQREVALLLAKRLERPERARAILEIGCGTGGFTELLKRRFSAATITSLDFSRAMIDFARAKAVFSSSTVEFLCEDAEKFLAETDRSFDLVTSNATIQWFGDVRSAVKRIAGLLLPGGGFVCSTFGPGTLCELGAGMASIFGERFHIPSARFPARNTLQQILLEYFDSVTVEEVCLTRRYDSLLGLLTQIRMTGTAGWQPSAPILTRRRLEKLSQWFARHKGGYEVTYQVFLVRCTNG